VRYSGTAETGPYESHDLSTFCTSEDHAVKVGAYILAKRLYTTHTIRFAARPQEHNTLISAGDIIRVQLARDNTTYANSVHDYLYQVERITKTLAGDVSYEATHFPIDDQGRSLIALDVAAAVGTGIILPSGRTGVSCDVNSSSDNTIPAETFTAADGDDPLELSPSGGGLGFNDSAPTGDTGNTDDGLDVPAFQMQAFPLSIAPPAGSIIVPVAGPCGASGVAVVNWYENGVLVATVDYTGGTPVYTVPVAVNNPIGFFPASTLGPNSVVLQVGAGPTITSELTCNNGIQVVSSATVGPGIVSQNYTFSVLIAGVWEFSSYTSYTYPPYIGDFLGVPAAYAYDLAFGGWFVARQASNITAVRIEQIV
jgi:hypothetical protein